MTTRTDNRGAERRTTRGAAMSNTLTIPTAAIPDRTLEQRLTALQHANQIRTHRADLKRQLKTRRTDIVSLVADPHDEIHTMKIIDLLLAAPKIGRVKANRWLTRAGISPSKTLGGLSDRQRHELTSLLRQAPVVAGAHREPYTA